MRVVSTNASEDESGFECPQWAERFAPNHYLKNSPIVNDFPDDGNAANAGGDSAWVPHDDGTIAAYFHMCMGCVMVAVGQQVIEGEILGLAGNSGASAGPHLHFQVFEDKTSFNNDDAMPITFSNVTGNMAPTGELNERQIYTAN